MTQEERAEKWFRNVPGAERLSPEERLRVCNRVAGETLLISLGLLVAELVVAYLVGGGAIIDQMADAVNGFAAEGPQYRFLALYGVILYLPFFVLPIVAGLVYRKGRLKAAARRA